MEGYEKIGAWDVSLALPQEARTALRDYFGLLKEKRVPLTVLLSDSYWLNKARDDVRLGRSPEECLEAYLERATKLEIPNEGLSYLDHCLFSSTVVLVEDPFLPIGNLRWGEGYPVRDYRADLPQNAVRNPVSKESGVLRLSNGEAWYGTTLSLNDPSAKGTIAKWKSYGFPVPDEVLGVTVVAAYRFQLVMDWVNLNARIEPLPTAKPSP